MSSFTQKVIYLPQCSTCHTAATDPADAQPQLDIPQIPAALWAHLAGLRWKIYRPEPGPSLYRRAGRRYAPAPPAEQVPDRLTCAACAEREDQRTAAFHTDLNRPLVTTVDMSRTLGPGWLLGQRDNADVDAQRWLVVHDEQVYGLVFRYRRKTDNQWSQGWEARTIGGGRLFIAEAPAGAMHAKAIRLWRSRQLAAWGVATRPSFYTELPDWARARKPRRRDA